MGRAVAPTPNQSSLAHGQASPTLTRCVALDIEVGANGLVQAFGAVRPDADRRLVHSGKGLSAALRRLDAFAQGTLFVLGHNVIKHDLPYLAAVNPNLQILTLPVIDTLRLSPLAFPRNPYHHLVKHYQDGALRRHRVNDPELDARLALRLFGDECAALEEAPSGLLAAWHWLCVPHHATLDMAMDWLFRRVRGSERPSRIKATQAVRQCLDGVACATGVQEILADLEAGDWALAYALAWLSVAGGNSVMPPWVRHQFPAAGRMVRRLRDLGCKDPGCGWCRERHDSRRELKHWFGFEGFRPDPRTDDGGSMQQAIVEEAMAGRHVFGILPTGAGKSLCYQLPALSRYEKTGALTVVISPLVALMADQVAGLERQGIACCVTVNGLLSMPERAEALERVRLGDAGIVLISPEQLRSRTLRRALDQREIGAWVLDEAHCLSRWGHDFRPDYRYVGRFIREKAGTGSIPPVLCLTATAKPDVIDDIRRHFRERLGVELGVFNGGAERPNLSFQVIPTTTGEKLSDIVRVLTSHLPSGAPGGAIVYCATRRKSEEVAGFLREKGMGADHFHAGLSPEVKKDVQHRFVAGELKVIVATNAFGMGIDKPDVRLVVHADIPGSLENYLQEAGRAGRDRASAQCVLLYAVDDVEHQFGMSARSRLTRVEINAILRALRHLDRRNSKHGSRDVVATAGEILIEDRDRAFDRDVLTDDTRVRTAVAWLEESELLTREENAVRVFPSSLRVSSVAQAQKRLAKAKISEDYRKKLLLIAQAMIAADADEGVSTDALMVASGLSPEGVRTALYDLEQFGIASNDTALTAFVHVGVKRSSQVRLMEAVELETSLIAHMRESAPDLGKGDRSFLHLRVAAQALRDRDVPDPLPERLLRIVRGIAFDGRGEGDGAAGSLAVRKRDAETVAVTLQREWGAVEETANLRREAAQRLLKHLISCVPTKSRGTDILAATTIGDLLHAIKTDLALAQRVQSPEKVLNRALLWLHEQEVVRLNKGLTVFRPAMTIRLQRRKRRPYTNADFKPLSLHYEGQVLQIHVMKEFAERGLAAMRDAMRLAMDYFALDEEEFLARWLSGRGKELGRQTTAASWGSIVESLGNPAQERIVTEGRRRKNMLVLAGPGSGKTRVLVHRIAWLILAKRERARGIIALTYNRHAAAEIRSRLVELVGREARGVTVLTCHALAMRLVGESFANRSRAPDTDVFRDVMKRAISLLQGSDLEPVEADKQRDRLMAGFRWIFVDEYQDVGPEQYALIAALAGRTLDDDTRKLTLFAVGDDDQNIYSFDGASVEFIRRFEADYDAAPRYLTDNYRSTGAIIRAANAVIEPARRRLKEGRPIRVDRARQRDLEGGEWTLRDPVCRGKVQALPAGGDLMSQAGAAVTEYERLAALDSDWDWSAAAVIARDWNQLDPVRALCEAKGIPVQMANEEIPSFWRLREVRALLRWLRERTPQIVDARALGAWVDARPTNGWHELLRQAVEEHRAETGGGEVPVSLFVEWLAEWGWEARRRQRGLLLLTAHRAKGLEFDHVVVLDGAWDRVGRGDDADAPRRLYYVAMTRARQTLTLARLEGSRGFAAVLADSGVATGRPDVEPAPPNEAAAYRHLRLALRDVDLGFAGRCQDRDPVHGAIAALSVGDPLDVRIGSGGRWELANQAEHVVGRLAKAFEPPEGMRPRSAEVYAVVRWSREASDPRYRPFFRREEWEVVVPELVFEPY